MTHLGDFIAGQTVRVWWNTNAIAGESITRATNGTVSVYKDGSTTQSTAGVTDTEDFDGLTGVHQVAVDTSADGAFYSSGSDFAVVLSAATIDGKTINAVLAQFSIENRNIKSNVTQWLGTAVATPAVAGRPSVDSIAVSGSTSAADSVESNIGNLDTAISTRLAAASYTSAPTVAQIRTEIDTNSTQLATILSDTDNIQTRLPAALVSGRMAADAVAISGSTAAADQVETNIHSLNYDLDLIAADASSASAAASATNAKFGSGITSVAGQQLDDWLLAMATAAATAPTALSGAGFVPATDSLEAIRDRGDAEWETAVGFSTLTAPEVRIEMEGAGTLLDSVKTKTDLLPSDPADQSSVEAALASLQAHGDTNWAGSSVDPADIVDALFDETLTAHDVVDTIAHQLLTINDVVAKTNLITNSTPASYSPRVMDGLLIELQEGTDYYVSDGPVPEWENLVDWPADLTDAVVKLYVYNQSTEIEHEFAATLVSAVAPNQVIRVELSRANITTMGVSDSGKVIHRYRLMATLSGGRIKCLAKGNIKVVKYE